MKQEYDEDLIFNRAECSYYNVVLALFIFFSLLLLLLLVV